MRISARNEKKLNSGRGGNNALSYNINSNSGMLNHVSFGFYQNCRGLRTK